MEGPHGQFRKLRGEKLCSMPLPILIRWDLRNIKDKKKITAIKCTQNFKELNIHKVKIRFLNLNLSHKQNVFLHK